MEQIRKYPFEFAKPLLLCFDLLNRCNIDFFDENVPFLFKYWRCFYMVPIVGIHYVSTTSYMVKIFSGPINISELAYMVSVYLIQMQCLLKVLIIIPKKRNISQLVTSLGTMWRVEHLNVGQILKKNNLLKRLNLSRVGPLISYITTKESFVNEVIQYGRRKLKGFRGYSILVFYWGSIIAAYQHFMAPLVLTLYRKFVLSQDCALQLPFGCVYPFDPVKNWCIYLVMYVFQTYSMLRVVYFYIGTEFLMITLSAHLTTEFTLLREDLLEVVPVSDEVNTGMVFEQGSGPITIKEFIRRHQKLIQLTKQLDSIFNKIIFVDLLFVTVINCFFGLGATVAHGLVDKVNNYVAVVVLMFPIYIFCYYGDLLKEESAGIAASTYENLWYQRSTAYQKIISFIIMRSQRPCCLTSLEYKPITLNTFTKVVSTTWSYFSLALCVYSKG